jgi:hypothetical protein
VDDLSTLHLTWDEQSGLISLIVTDGGDDIPIGSVGDDRGCPREWLREWDDLHRMIVEHEADGEAYEATVREAWASSRGI